MAIAVFIFFTGAYMDHKHSGRFFKRSEEEPTEVMLHNESAMQLARSLSDAVTPAIGGASFHTSRDAIRGGQFSDAVRDMNVVIDK